MNALIAAMVFVWTYILLTIAWRSRRGPIESLGVALRMMTPEQRHSLLQPYIQASEAAARRHTHKGMWDAEDCALELLATDNEGMLSPIRPRGIVSSGPVKPEAAIRAAREAQKARLVSVGVAEAFKRPKKAEAAAALNGATPHLAIG